MVLRTERSLILGDRRTSTRLPPLGLVQLCERFRYLYRVGEGADVWRMPTTPVSTLCGRSDFTRPDQDGHIVGYEGLEKVQHAFGDNILKMHLPGPARTNSVASGYLGHAWMWVRHEDYDACCQILDVIGDTVKMRAR